jgi:hypothetical protein
MVKVLINLANEHIKERFKMENLMVKEFSNIQTKIDMKANLKIT